MWRGVSLRKLGLLAFGPMLVEALSQLLLAWMVLVAVRDMLYEPRHQMLIAASGSVGYALSAQIAGRWVTPRWAPRLMLTMALAVTGLGLSAMTLRTLPAFMILSLLIGICLGHYFVPFQINMTHVRPFHTLAWSVAFYNIAWGTGAAIGPFIGSSLRPASLGMLAGVALAIVTIHTLLNLLAHYAPQPRREITPEVAFHATARHRRTVLLAFGITALLIRGLYVTLWPDFGAARGWSDAAIGFGQFIMFAPITFASLLWARLRRYLDRPWIMLATMVLGCAGFVLLPATTTYAAAMACAAAVGIMESCIVFHAIYYMNSDPDPVKRARHVGGFEMCVGLAYIAGPLAMGLLAWDDATRGRPYLMGSAVLAGIIVFITTRAIIRTPATHHAPRSPGTGPS